MAGSKPQDYAWTPVADPIDPSKKCRALRYVDTDRASDMGFGTLMQTFDASKYRGKRVRFSARVRTEAFGEWVGLWMRVDAAEKRGIAFDNMARRPIRGTTDWARYEVVLDVADDATSISLGILMGGSGAAWMSDATFEAVGTDVPVTASPLARLAADFTR